MPTHSHKVTKRKTRNDMGSLSLQVPQVKLDRGVVSKRPIWQMEDNL